MACKYVPRAKSQPVYDEMITVGFSPLQAEIGSRRLAEPSLIADFFTPRLQNLAHPKLLKDGEKAAKRIAQAVQQGETIAILTDYDVDGLASHAIMVRSFIDHFLVPEQRLRRYVGNRLEDGYGLTAAMATRIAADDSKPSLLITADCGISDGLQIADLARQMDVIVTDHHLVPVDSFPCRAHSVVDPQQDDCTYPDKDIAGCMVCWLVMSLVRTMLEEDGHLLPGSPKLGNLLDFVALGTVADSMSLLSLVNRTVVQAGLQLCQQQARPCWRAFTSLLGRQGITADDFSYQLGPRINAASRMATAQPALNFLLADDVEQASRFLSQLDQFNVERKLTEKKAMEICDYFLRPTKEYALIAIQHPDFHPGVLGIIASRLNEQYGCPAIVCCPADETAEVLTGSGRSTKSIHLPKALQQLAQQSNSGLISYGGHAVACGVKVETGRFEHFKDLLTQVIEQQQGETVDEEVEIDGPLNPDYLSQQAFMELEQLGPFGKQFPTPCFSNNFVIHSFQFVGEEKNHLRLQLLAGTKKLTAIWFRCHQAELSFLTKGIEVQVVYSLSVNHYRQNVSLQLLVHHLAAGSAAH